MLPLAHFYELTSPERENHQKLLEFILLIGICFFGMQHFLHPLVEREWILRECPQAALTFVFYPFMIIPLIFLIFLACFLHSQNRDLFQEPFCSTSWIIHSHLLSYTLPQDYHMGLLHQDINEY